MQLTRVSECDSDTISRLWLASSYRLIFDDRSDSPFFLLVGPGQFDRVLAGKEHGKPFDFIAYGRGLRVLCKVTGIFHRVAFLSEI